jgi:Zn-finger domain-containing protein
MVVSSGDIVNNHESSQPLALMGLNITYAPRTAIKSLVLADFMAEWTEEQASTIPTRFDY